MIEGLRERVSELSKDLGPMTKNEIISLAIVGAAIVVMSLQVMIPPLTSPGQVGNLSRVYHSILRLTDTGYRRLGTDTLEYRAPISPEP